MKEEYKELLLKDLCARLPYGVICHANEINLDGELLFINKVYSTVALYNDNATGKFDTCPIEDIKPYLRSMSSMTEEERKEYKHLVAFGGNSNGAANFIDWLNKKMFAYRTIDDKDMFELGLALEASKDMYKF